MSWHSALEGSETRVTCRCFSSYLGGPSQNLQGHQQMQIHTWSHQSPCPPTKPAQASNEIKQKETRTFGTLLCFFWVCVSVCFFYAPILVLLEFLPVWKTPGCARCLSSAAWTRWTCHRLTTCLEVDICWFNSYYADLFEMESATHHQIQHPNRISSRL